MSYQIRRIDPYWIRHPFLVALTLGGAVLALAGLLASGGAGSAGLGSPRGIVTVLGFLLTGGGILALTKPTVSVALGTLGMIGGLLTFVILPNAQTADLSIFFKFVAAILFGLFYTILMDAVVLVAVFFYNFFSLTLGGVEVELEESTETPEA